MKIFLIKIFIAIFVASNVSGADFSKELAEIESGKREEARAEWWGYNQDKDNTKNLQAALDSGVKKLVISKQTGPWLLKSRINLPSNMEIVFEDGAEIKAMRGYFKKIGDMLIKAKFSKNLVLRGKGIITMHKHDYQNPKEYKAGEHRHALALFACENIKIEGLTLHKSGGDGIYVNNVKNLLIDNVLLDEHHRQGISVINAENLLIKNCLIKNTNGIAPECGIDFEPNPGLGRLVNCRVEDCTFENNAYSAVHCNVTNIVSSKTHPVDITVTDCTMKGGKYGISFMQLQTSGKESTATGKIIFRNCKIENPKFTGIYLDSVRGSGPQRIFENLSVVQHTKEAPIYFYLRKLLTENAGNVSFSKCVFNASNSKEALDCVNLSNYSLDRVSGNVLLNGRSINLEKLIKRKGLNNEVPILTLKKVVPEKLYTASLGNSAGNKKSILRLRGTAKILLSAQQGSKVVFSMEYKRLGRYKTPPLKLNAIGPNGQKIDLGELKYIPGKAQVFNFVPPQTGNYIINTGTINCLTMSKCSVPWVVFCRPKRGVYNLLAPNGSVYFSIPANVESFYIEVAGSGNAGSVDAKVKVDGKLVGSAKRIYRSKYFHVRLEADPKARLGELALKSGGGVFVSFPEPLLPIFGNSPQNVFLEKTD